MNKKLAYLAQHRQELVAQAEEQRAALVQHLESWRTPLTFADYGLSVVHYVKRHPVLTTGIAALFTMFHPKRAGKWLKSGLAALQVVNYVRNWLKKP